MAINPLFADPLAAFKEQQWLMRNPAFKERPASLEEFLGEFYLNIAAGVREGVKDCLVKIFGVEPNVYNLANVQRAMFTGAIGVGKTTFASIALPYMVHWCLCLKDPQDFFGLLPGSRIAFMMMSTSEKQAKEVLFGDIFARINNSPWFKDWPHDPKFTTQIRFAKDIWIVPGDSRETSFEGYNILGGIIDEIDSHVVTEKKDYAEAGYDTIHARITSRFQNRGLLILIGQMKKSTGFAARKYEEFVTDGFAGGNFARKLTIWESLGWHRFIKDNGSRDSFWFDPKRKVIVPPMQVEFMDKDLLMEIPVVYEKDFRNNPEKALRDLAGVPPLVGDAFISMVDRVEACRDKWHKRFGIEESPVGTQISSPEFPDWFIATDSLRRVIHIDVAYSARGDALGLAMGHIREVKEVDGEMKPVIVFDLLLRMRALPGTQLQLADVRQIVYRLKDERKFNIKEITMDGFQSTDSLQQFNKRRFRANLLSVDKEILPYHDLREAIYDDRCEFPRYMTYMKHGDTELKEIAVFELLRLIEKENGKIDHPENGSKDVSDAMAGVATTLMGDRSYRRGISSSPSEPSVMLDAGDGGIQMPGYKSDMPGGGYGNRITVPSMGDLSSGGGMLPRLPAHLMPRRNQ